MTKHQGGHVSTADLLRNYLETIPDFDRLAPLLHEDATFTLFAMGGKTNRGRERILKGLRREFENFYDNDTFALEVLMTFGDATYAGGRFRITADTRLGPYNNDYCIIARFENGKLIEGWEYVDSAHAAAQLSK